MGMQSTKRQIFQRQNTLLFAPNIVAVRQTAICMDVHNSNTREAAITEPASIHNSPLHASPMYRDFLCMVRGEPITNRLFRFSFLEC